MIGRQRATLRNGCIDGCTARSRLSTGPYEKASLSDDANDGRDRVEARDRARAERIGYAALGGRLQKVHQLSLQSVDVAALAKIFDLDPSDEKQSFLLDLHLHNYSFCRQKHFQLNQTSVFLGICHTLMKRDFARDSTTDLKSSFDFFQAILLTHSVNRSPKSVGIFSREEVAAIVDYVTNSYFRHFQLYKCIYTPHYHVHFVQREINGIQTPSAPRPLSMGFLHSIKPFPPVESNERVHSEEVDSEAPSSE